MKNILFVLTGLMLIQLQTQAQTKEGNSRAKNPAVATPLRISPQLGISSFAIKTEDLEIGAKDGLTVGMNSYMEIAPEVDFETGLHYMTMGGQQKGTLFGESISNTLSLSYLAIPLSVRYKFHQMEGPGDPRLYIKGGMTLAFLTSAKQDLTLGSVSVNRDIIEKTKGFDLLPSISLGGSYNLGNFQEVLVDITYMRGTQSVFSEFQSSNEGMIGTISYSLEI